MISARIGTDLATLNASIQAVAPIRQATQLLKAALVNAGAGLVAEIDAGIAAAVGALDGPDPAGYAGDLVTALLALDAAASDQAALADMRATVGRAVFNMRKV